MVCDSRRGISFINHMSHTEITFDEIFSAFKEKFPPAPDLDHATLRMTIGNVAQTILSLSDIEIEFPEIGLANWMKGQGYNYEPLEENGRICFYWLISQDQGNHA